MIKYERIMDKSSEISALFNNNAGVSKLYLNKLKEYARPLFRLPLNFNIDEQVYGKLLQRVFESFDVRIAIGYFISNSYLIMFKFLFRQIINETLDEAMERSLISEDVCERLCLDEEDRVFLRHCREYGEFD